MPNQQIWSPRCWTCLRAQEDPQEKYVCPKVQEHWKDYEKQTENYEAK